MLSDRYHNGSANLVEPLTMISMINDWFTDQPLLTTTGHWKCFTFAPCIAGCAGRQKQLCRKVTASRIMSTAKSCAEARDIYRSTSPTTSWCCDIPRHQMGKPCANRNDFTPNQIGSPEWLEASPVMDMSTHSQTWMTIYKRHQTPRAINHRLCWIINHWPCCVVVDPAQH